MTDSLAQPADWLLEVNNLSCGYGDGSVVRNVNFALSHGDIGCLPGPTGLHKNTTLGAFAVFFPGKTCAIFL